MPSLLRIDVWTSVWTTSLTIVTLVQMTLVYTLLVITVLTVSVDCLGRDEMCASPQYLEFGRTGTIDCTFQEGFFAVLWYNTSNLSEDVLLLHYQSSFKLGPGYQSGEFDIFPNGSLIITNVTHQHDHNFGVVYMPSDEDEPYPIDVRIIVTIPAYPVIDECNQQQTCIIEAKSDGNLTCRVRGIRPSVRLKWKVFKKSDTDVVSFTNELLTIEDTGNSYDISFTSTYHISDESRNEMTIECVDSDEVFSLSAQIELLISKTPPGETTAANPSSLTVISPVSNADVEKNDVQNSQRALWAVLATVIFGTVILAVSVVYLCLKLCGLEDKLHIACNFVGKHMNEEVQSMRYKRLRGEGNGYIAGTI